MNFKGNSDFILKQENLPYYNSPVLQLLWTPKLNYETNHPTIIAMCPSFVKHPLSCR